MTRRIALTLLLAALSLGLTGSTCVVRKGDSLIVVGTTRDLASPPDGTVSLRSALAMAKSGQRIVFDESLDGDTIELSIVAEEHSMLEGEVMGIRMEPSGPVSYLVGYRERDYGRSALYARKNVVIDASELPNGITIAWTGGDADPARVLAVRGHLTMKNVTVTGGRVVTEDISTGDPNDQPWTLARGGALAVWGVARLTDCVIHDNHVVGDFDPSRDRGAFGGGVYADVVDMERCVVSGNSVTGGGAAGGGVFSVGGAAPDRTLESRIDDSSITGNRIRGLFTYGGGVYSDGGGIGKRRSLELVNTTVARNLVEPAPGLPPFVLAGGYWRGGGVYVSNGELSIDACTIVENEVYGVPRTDSLSRPNLAGGVAATIGNAHSVEDLMIGRSIIVGNKVHEVVPGGGGASYDHDIFTGSAFYFRSQGFNRIGVIDFSQILVPVGQPDWESLSRRHYPKQGDRDGVTPDDVLNLATGITRSASVTSVGVDEAALAVLHYEPKGLALDLVPTDAYDVHEVLAEYRVSSGGTDDFLAILLGRIEAHYLLPGFAADFTADFEAFLQAVDRDEGTPELDPYTDPSGQPVLTLADTHWFGPAVTWPKQLVNYPYIEFWHRLDAALAAQNIPGMGPEGIGDDAWHALFEPGRLDENRDITFWKETGAGLRVQPCTTDQLGSGRPANALADIGAIEIY